MNHELIYKVLPNKINVNMNFGIINKMKEHFKVISLPIVKITKSLKLYCGLTDIELPIKSFRISNLVTTDILSKKYLEINVLLNILDIIKKKDIIDIEYFLYDRKDIFAFNNVFYSDYKDYKLHILFTQVDVDYLDAIYNHIKYK